MNLFPRIQSGVHLPRLFILTIALVIFGGTTFQLIAREGESTENTDGYKSTLYVDSDFSGKVFVAGIGFVPESGLSLFPGDYQLVLISDRSEMAFPIVYSVGSEDIYLDMGYLRSHDEGLLPSIRKAMLEEAPFSMNQNLIMREDIQETKLPLVAKLNGHAMRFGFLRFRGDDRNNYDVLLIEGSPVERILLEGPYSVTELDRSNFVRSDTGYRSETIANEVYVCELFNEPSIVRTTARTHYHSVEVYSISEVVGGTLVLNDKRSLGMSGEEIYWHNLYLNPECENGEFGASCKCDNAFDWSNLTPEGTG